jgi:5'-AMP-activated protein kinase catalytic alpha subunit
LSEVLLDEDGNLRETEVAALLSLDHPNIIRLYDIFADCGSLFLIFDLCDCGTLEDEIARDGPFKPARIVAYLRQLASALDYCHNQQVAHRDIKPANIFIDRYDRPILADFGLSAIANDLVSTVCGSHLFLAPEINDIQPFDAMKADVWALGVTSYVMATGHPPHLAGQFDFPVAFDDRIRRLILWMLTPDAARRPGARQVLTSPFLERKGQTLIQPARGVRAFKSFMPRVHGQWQSAKIIPTRLSPSEPGLKFKPKSSFEEGDCL